ncbi:MAG: NAD(+)/NADH kinase [Clostridia bacterium]|nr:NAD(+)/NADH kinase [Clostridia bacterium]
MKKIYVYNNETALSCHVADVLCEKLSSAGFYVPACFSECVELLVCVGGDGTLLKGLHAFDFPNIPVVGVNTGHLGFFQELQHDELDRLVTLCREEKYSIQRHRLLRSTIYTGEGHSTVYRGLNDIVIKGSVSRITHLNMMIGTSFIERFSGDGILIASSAGSTAYNYSLGGSIVDPRLHLLQITPIAPMNTTAFRCFTSSVLLPSDMEIHISPEYDYDRGAVVVVDGTEHTFEDVKKVTVDLCQQEVQLIRLENYDFWSKVKTKFL